MTFLEISGPFFALFGAALAAGLGAIGSSFGVGIAGQAATGLSAEKPELSGKALILEALPSSQAIYGLVGAFFVLKFITDDIMSLNAAQGLSLFVASLPLAVSAFFSGIYQGKVLAGGMNMLAKGESNFGKAIALAVMVETFALFGLLISILMYLDIKAAIA